MIILQFANTRIDVLEAEKNMLGALTIQKIMHLHTQEDQDWEQLLQTLIQNKEVGILLPDTHTYVHRFSIPSDASKQVVGSFIVKKAKELIPEKPAELLSDYKKLKPDEVLFAASSVSMVSPVVKSIQNKGGKISFCTIEAVALFPLIQTVIKPQETLGYLFLDADSSLLMLFDEDGPLFSFSEPIQKDKIKDSVQKSLSYFETKYVQQITSIITDGEDGLVMEDKTYQDIFGDRPRISAEQVRSTVYKSKQVKTPTSTESSSIPLGLLGCLLLFYEKDSINLLTKEKLEQLRSQPQPLAKQENHTDSTSSPLKHRGVPTITLSNEADPEEQLKKTRRSRLVTVGMVICVLGLLTIAGILGYRYYQGRNTVQAELPVTPTIVPPTQTPTPTPQLDRAQLSIRVLNGTGEAGVASTAQELLESKGYESIETDNAEEFTYASTVIQLTEEKESYRSLLEQDLAESYAIATEESVLEKESDIDAVIIIGSE